MGHAHHFLSRLDRLTRNHVDLALTLYRDDERLRYVLEHADVPEGAERVALSLDDPREGPFVVVTRTGRFVTCLGRGMRVSDLPVITRPELDAISEKLVVFKERDAVRERLTGPDFEAGFLLSRILDSGPFLAREELQALAALQPLIGEEYLKTASEWALASRRIQLKLRHALKKRGARLRPEQLEQLKVYYQTFFASSHLAVLALSDGGEMIERLAGDDEALFSSLAKGVAAVVVDGCILSKTVRASWALGQLGERFLPHAERWYATASDAYHGLGASLALLAIGARHEGLRDRVIRFFTETPLPENPEARTWAHCVSEGGKVLLADVDGVVAEQRTLGADMAMQVCEAYPKGSPYRYARPEEVPADIAFAHPFHYVGDFVRDPKVRAYTITMVVPAAHAEPEQLYLPRRCVEFLESKWEPEDSMEIMGVFLESLHQPAPRPTGPTRSGPCPCGSGKKYKRCCAPAEVG